MNLTKDLEMIGEMTEQERFTKKDMSKTVYVALFASKYYDNQFPLCVAITEEKAIEGAIRNVEGYYNPRYEVFTAEDFDVYEMELKE